MLFSTLQFLSNVIILQIRGFFKTTILIAIKYFSVNFSNTLNVAHDITQQCYIFLFFPSFPIGKWRVKFSYSMEWISMLLQYVTTSALSKVSNTKQNYLTPFDIQNLYEIFMSFRNYEYHDYYTHSWSEYKRLMFLIR